MWNLQNSPYPTEMVDDRTFNNKSYKILRSFHRPVQVDRSLHKPPVTLYLVKPLGDAMVISGEVPGLFPTMGPSSLTGGQWPETPCSKQRQQVVTSVANAKLWFLLKKIWNLGVLLTKLEKMEFYWRICHL